MSVSRQLRVSFESQARYRKTPGRLIPSRHFEDQRKHVLIEYEFVSALYGGANVRLYKPLPISSVDISVDVSTSSVDKSVVSVLLVPMLNGTL